MEVLFQKFLNYMKTEDNQPETQISLANRSVSEKRPQPNFQAGPQGRSMQNFPSLERNHSLHEQEGHANNRQVPGMAELMANDMAKHPAHDQAYPLSRKHSSSNFNTDQFLHKTNQEDRGFRVD